MKFKRINYLKPIRTFRGHYFDITLEYEMDLEGPTGVNVSDFTAWVAKGVLEYQLTEAVDSLQIRIRGRFYEVFSEGLLLQITLPELGGIFRDSIVNETIQIECMQDVFWTGNPIRIPLRNRPTEPVGLWVEEQFASGNFRKVASLKVADITDQYGYYVEVDQILQPYLERQPQKDFPGFFDLENDEFAFYRQSARRFHLGGAESLMDGAPVPNFFTAIAGKQDPETAFRTGNFWGKTEPFLSWRPENFRQKMAAGYPQRLPLSILLDVAEYTITKTNSETGDENQIIYQNQGETIVDVVLSQNYSFALSHQADGTRVLISEAEGAYFRAIAFFPNIVATHLIVREIVDEMPLLMLVHPGTAPGSWQVQGFRAPIFAELDVLWVHTVYQAFENAVFQLTAAGPKFGTGCVLIFNVAETLHHAAVQVPETTGESVMETFFSTDNYIANAVAGTDDGQFVIGSSRSGIIKTDDNFVSFTTIVGASYKEYFQIEVLSGSRVFVMGYDNDNFVMYEIDPGPGTVTTSYTPAPSIGYAGRRKFCLRDNRILVVATASSYELLSIDGGVSLVDAVSTFPGDTWLPSPMRGLTTVIVAGMVGYENRWIGYVMGFDAKDPATVGYLMQRLELGPDPVLLTFKIADLTEVTYAADGSYMRQARQLYFRNQAGAYEFLLLPGDGGTTHTSRKVMSSRYVDAASAMADGEEMIAWVNDSSRTLSTNTGFISKREYDYFLQELLLTKEAYLVENGDWCPVKLNLAKAEPVMDRPNLYQIDLNLEKSWSR